MELPYTVGKFELFERINEGAFAVVYKARNKETKEIVAVKKMKKMTKQVILGLYRMQKWSRKKSES